MRRPGCRRVAAGQHFAAPWYARCCWTPLPRPGPAPGMTRQPSPSTSSPAGRPARKGPPAAPGARARRTRARPSWCPGPRSACMPCPARQLCTSGRRRQVTIRPCELYEAVAGPPTSPEIRSARYPGLPKTRLEHNLAAAANCMIRPDAYWTGQPLGPHANNPPHPPRLHPHRVSRISQQGPARSGWALLRKRRLPASGSAEPLAGQGAAVPAARRLPATR
jgi:hypothetical protein